INHFTIVFVMCTRIDLFKSIQYIRLHHDEFGHTVQHDGVAQCRKINPSCAACTPCGSAKLVSQLTQFFTGLVIQLGREWSPAHTWTACFVDTVDVTYVLRCDTQSGTCSCGSRVGRCHKWIRTEVYVR